MAVDAVPAEQDEHPAVALLKRAERSASSKSTNNKNRALIREMSILIVQQAGIIADLQQRLGGAPRIVLPS